MFAVLTTHPCHFTYNTILCPLFNPFLFIRGLFCHHSVQGVAWLLNEKHRSSIGLEIRPKSVITAFRALLPSANYFAE